MGRYGYLIVVMTATFSALGRSEDGRKFHGQWEQEIMLISSLSCVGKASFLLPHVLMLVASKDR